MKYHSIQATFQDVEVFNSSFLKTKIKVFAFGKNRNQSSIGKAAFNKARNSIYNIPVVAKFNIKKDKYGNEGDLEDHNEYIAEDKDGNLVLKQDTFPIGVVSSDANITYEEVNEGTSEEPNIKTYVCVDNVYLWRRYDATEKIFEWLQAGIPPKVSMEIGNVSGDFNRSGVFVIEDFEFKAIAALGSEVEPCFPMAQIELYSKQTFEDAFYQMLEELNYSLRGGEASIMQNKSNNRLNSGETTGGEENKMKTKTKREVAKSFNLTHTQLIEKIDCVLSQYTMTSDDLLEGKLSLSRYSLLDYDEKYVYVRDRRECVDLKMSYTKSEEGIQIDVENSAPVKQKFEDVEDEVDVQKDKDNDGDNEEIEQKEIYKLAEKHIAAQLEVFINGLKGDFEKQIEEKNKEIKSKDEVNFELTKRIDQLQEQLSMVEENMRKFADEKEKLEKEERKRKEEELFSLFADKLTSEEIEEFRSKASSYALVEDLEKDIKLHIVDRVLEQSKSFNKNPSLLYMGIPSGKAEVQDTIKSSSIWDRLSE